MPRSSSNPRAPSSRSWDAVAEWYLGWSGTHGSLHHRHVAIPLLLELLNPQPGERVLDIGCGPGALTPHLARRGCSLVGIDRSRRLIDAARRAHGASGRFYTGDATDSNTLAGIAREPFDAATFLLSIQDIDPLADALRAARSRLTDSGRLVIVMIHPCFRVPRQSGWGWDAQRQLQYRRIDRYLTPLAVPMRTTPDGRTATRSYHRPLEQYVSALSDAGFVMEALREVSSNAEARGNTARALRRAEDEFPLFLGIRARCVRVSS